MIAVDLLFPVIGKRLPTDHAYPLYSAISGLLPRLHSGEVPFGLVPVTGEYAGNGQLLLDPQRSRLRLRLSADHIPAVLPLAGKQVRVQGHQLRIGVPQVCALMPSPDLFSPVVTIKHATDEGAFATRARQQLDALGVTGEAEVARHLAGSRRGEVRRCILRVKDNAVVCFGLIVRGLNDEESLKLQAAGIGGRRHMGAGLFFPARQEDEK